MKGGHRAGAKARLHFDERGLRIEPKQGAIAQLEWGSVLEVFAFKDDAFAYDIICIGFRTDDVGGYFKIDEECEGYESLLDFLPEVFSEIRTDWFSDVAFPAFEPCVTTLWGTEMMAKIWGHGTVDDKPPETRPLADDPWGLDPGVTRQSLEGAFFQAISRIFRPK